MLKNHIELIRSGEPQVVLTWHMPDGNGGHIPIAIEFSDEVDEDMRKQIEQATQRPINVRDNGNLKKVFSGSSAHFVALPKALGRLGFRTRVF